MKELVDPIKNQKLYPLALREPTFVSVALRGDLTSTKKFLDNINTKKIKETTIKINPMIKSKRKVKDP